MSNTEPNIPVVSAIVERTRNGQKEILVQTRWKPSRDPIYSGTLEIPAGWVDLYENVYDALKREVLEETGLKVIKITPDIKTKVHSPRDDGAFAFVPFCAQQQIKSGSELYSAPSARSDFSLTSCEVSLCEDVLTFARTFFQDQTN